MLYKKSILFLLFLFYFFKIDSFAEETSNIETVTAIGSYIGSGKISHRDQAVSNGIKACVEIACLKVLPQDLIVKNFQKINEFILEKPNQFIQSYKVVADIGAQNKAYKVIVQASVFASKIKDTISTAGMSIASQNSTNSRILLLISEQNIKDTPLNYWWQKKISMQKTITEEALTFELKTRGFEVIDPQSMLQKVQFDPNNFKADLDEKQAISLGNIFSADIVIYGKAAVSKGGNTSDNLLSFKGNLTANIFSVKTGEKIADYNQSVSAVNSDEIIGCKEALSRTGTLSGQEIASKINTILKDAATKNSSLEILVEGANNIANFTAFRKVLSVIEGVKGVEIKELQSNTATIVLDFQEGEKNFAERLMLKNFEKFSINIYETKKNNIKLKLVPNP